MLILENPERMKEREKERVRAQVCLRECAVYGERCVCIVKDTCLFGWTIVIEEHDLVTAGRIMIMVGS